MVRGCIPIALILCFLMSPTPSTRAAGTMYASDAEHTNSFDDGGRHPNGKLRWIGHADDSGTMVVTQPVVENGVVYIAGYDWRVYAFDAKDGSRLWSSVVLNDSGGFPRLRTLSILGDYVVATGDYIYALNKTTGARAWTNTDMPLDSPYKHFPGRAVVWNNYIVVADAGDTGGTIGVIGADGKSLWIKTTSEWFQWGGIEINYMAIHDGQLYFTVAKNSETMFRVDVLTGGGAYSEMNLDGRLVYEESDLSYANGYIYSRNNTNLCRAVLAWDSSTLRPVRQTDFSSTNSCASGAVALGEDKVFSGCNATEIMAVDAISGEKLWTSSLSTASWIGFKGPFAYANGILYISAEDNYLYAVDASDGSKLWSYHHEGMNLMTPPTVADGMVYVAGYILGKSDVLLAIGTAPNGAAVPVINSLLLGD